MYNVLKAQPKEILVRESPVLLVSALIAEFFYKFGSFSLELIAFFLTWYALSWLLSQNNSKSKKCPTHQLNKI